MGLSKTARIMIAATVVICLALLAAGLAVINLVGAVSEFEKPLPFAAGLALGCAVSVIKIILLEKSIKLTLDIGEKSKAAPIGSLLYLARFALTGAVLVLAFIFHGIFGRIGAVAGILSMQLAAYTANIFLKKQQPDDFSRLNDLSADDEEDDESEDDGENDKDDDIIGEILK